MEENDLIILENGAQFRKRRESNEIFIESNSLKFIDKKELEIEAKRVRELNTYLLYHKYDKRKYVSNFETEKWSKRAIKYSGEIPKQLLGRRTYWY